MKLRKKLFPLSFLLLTILVAVFVMQFRPKEVIDFNQTPGAYNVPLFNAELHDWRGKYFRLDEIKNKFIYIHFLDFNFVPDRDFLMKVFREWADSRIEIIIFTEYPYLLLASHPELLDRVIIVDKDLQKVRNLLGSDKDYSFCYLFDYNKKFVIKAQTSRPYELGMNYEIMKILKSNYFHPNELLGGNSNLYKTNIFNDILHNIPHNKNKYLIISLIASYCDGCAEGRLVSNIKKLYEKGIAETGIIFYKSLNKNDINNFVSTFDIKFPVINAKGDLLAEWDNLIKEYSWSAVSTIILLASGDGEIIDSYYKGCNCEGEFETALNKLINRWIIK